MTFIVMNLKSGAPRASGHISHIAQTCHARYMYYNIIILNFLHSKNETST